MSVQEKETVLGDVVKWETPFEYCRETRVVSRDLAAARDLNVGELCEPDTAVAQVHTYASALGFVPDGGTYRLGYKGEWTGDLAYDLNAAGIKAAFEALSTVTDTITASATCQIADTITWTTAGPKDEIDVDTRLLTDGGVVCSDLYCPVSTIGSLVASMVITATGANVTGILLEKVTKEELLVGNNIRRAFLVRGAAIVDSDQITCATAQKAAGIAAMEALGVQMRTEPDIYQSGPPTS